MANSDLKTGEIWLLRHGETEWSLSGQHTSRTDIPLTPAGEQRARALGQFIAGKKFLLVLTSPMARAKNTCALAGYGERAQVDPNLMEWDYGDYEGLTTTEIRRAEPAQNGPAWTIWNSAPKGGESVVQVGARADRVIATASAVDGDMALFGHGHMLRILAARWLGLDPVQGQLFALGTGSLSVLGHERGTRVIQQWNFTPYAQPWHGRRFPLSVRMRPQPLYGCGPIY